MHITHKDLFSILKLLIVQYNKSGSVTPVVTIGKTNVECLIQKDINNNFKTNNFFYQIIKKVQVKINILKTAVQWRVSEASINEV